MDPNGKVPSLLAIRNPANAPQWVVFYRIDGRICSVWYPTEKHAWTHHGEYLRRGTARLLRVRYEKPPAAG